jgi:hypothetical protein
MAAHHSVSPQQFGNLHEVAAAGYNTDEWSTWQQGKCGTYACGLQQLKPDLHFGTIEGGSHFFAHDETHAYDSAGRHPLPYTGIEGHPGEVELHSSAEYWGVPHDEHGPEGSEGHIKAAMEHAQRHGILEGRYQRRT